jgi:hypothetical protein
MQRYLDRKTQLVKMSPIFHETKISNTYFQNCPPVTHIVHTKILSRHLDVFGRCLAQTSVGSSATTNEVCIFFLCSSRHIPGHYLTLGTTVSFRILSKSLFLNYAANWGCNVLITIIVKNETQTIKIHVRFGLKKLQGLHMSIIFHDSSSGIKNFAGGIEAFLLASRIFFT